MTSSIDGAAFVVGTLAIFLLAMIGGVTVGVLSYLGILTLRNQLERVAAADQLISMEQERMKLEEMARESKRE